MTSPLGGQVQETVDRSIGAAAAEAPPPTELSFAVRYKDWIDEQNRRFEEFGLWNDEFRAW